MAKLGPIRASIYAHFKSKADLVAEAITEVAHELAASLLAKVIGAVALSRAVDHSHSSDQPLSARRTRDHHRIRLDAPFKD